MPREAQSNPPPSDPAASLPRRVVLWGVLGIVAMTLAAYLPAILHGGFIWDDDAYVTANPLLTAPGGLRRIWFSPHYQGQYFPLVHTTFWVEHALWGWNPLGYHLVNVLLHCANALLAWAVLRRLAIPGAWLAAAIFALHPVQVESAAWIAELKNTESTLLFLLALLAWMKVTEAKGVRFWRLYALTFFLYALALLAKTTACTFPAAMALVLWLRQEPISRRRLLQIAPFLAFGIALGLVSIWWEKHLGNYGDRYHLKFSLAERLLIATRAPWFYLGKLFWPADLAFSYPRWQLNPREAAQWLWAVGGIAGAGLLFAWRRRAWARGLAAALFFFVATLSPMLGFIPLFTFYYTFVADHYQYLACLGPIAFCAAGVTRLARQGRGWALGQTLGCLLLLSVLGALTFAQAGHYRDDETNWRATVARNPGSWMAWNNLAVIYFEKAGTAYRRGESAPAAAAYERCAEYARRAIAAKPDHATAHLTLADALRALGRPAEALERAQKGLELVLQSYASEPDKLRQHSLSNDHFRIGELQLTLGHAAAAETAYRQAIRVDGRDPFPRLALGELLLEQSRTAEAGEHFHAVLQSLPPGIFAARGFDAFRAGQAAFAGEVFGQAAEALRKTSAPPGSAVQLARLQMARLLAGASDPEIQDPPRAVKVLERIVADTGRAPPELLDALAFTQAAAGRPQEAARVAGEALALAEQAQNQALARQIRARRDAYLAAASPR